VRAQGALITGSEVARLVEFWARQARPDNLLDVEFVPIEDDEKSKRDVDPLCYEAARFIIESKFASTAQLQQRFSIGHPRAVRDHEAARRFRRRRSARRHQGPPDQHRPSRTRNDRRASAAPSRRTCSRKVPRRDCVRAARATRFQPQTRVARRRRAVVRRHGTKAALLLTDTGLSPSTRRFRACC
jgi:DNA segregation ATPase FtsK/SpoIIIE-like protein